MIQVNVFNVKSQIINFSSLDLNIQNEICFACSYEKIGFTKEPRKYLLNPINGITYTGLLPYIFNILKKYNIKYVIKDNRNIPVKKYNWNIVNGYLLRDYQERLVNSSVKHNRRVFLSCVSSGKALTLDSLILTPTGFKQMKDIHINDIVYDENGKETKVIGEYPQGLKDVYKITFSDNTSVKCCIDHLWKCHNGIRWNTKSLKKLLKEDYTKYFIPINKPIQFNSTKLKINPFLIGFLCSNKAKQLITANEEEKIDCIIYLLQHVTYSEFCLLYTDYLDQFKKETQEKGYKCIPRQYLYASIKDRQKLFQGLFNGNNSMNIEEVNIDDVKFLLYSLGYRCKIENNRIYAIKDKLYITDIQKLETKEEMKCIAVDSPKHTYICNDFIVTHNTFIISNIIKEHGVNTLVIVPQISLSTQTRNDIQEALGVHVGIVNGTVHDINSPVIVATPQSVINYPSILEKADMLICDECHTVPSETIYSVCNKCKNAYYRYALSGSCWRDDNTALLLDAAFTVRDPKDTISISELIRKGILMPVNITYFNCPESVKPTKNTYSDIYRKNIIYHELRNNKIISLAKKHFLNNDSILVLFKYIEHGQLLLEKCLNEIENKKFLYKYKNKIYIFNTIELVDGKVELDRRDAVFQAIKDKKIKIMIASSVADMGLNIPILSVLILAGSGKSTTSAFQRVGRVIRPYKGKKKSYVYDFFDQQSTLNTHAKIRYQLMQLEPEIKQTIVNI